MRRQYALFIALAVLMLAACVSAPSIAGKSGDLGTSATNVSPGLTFTTNPKDPPAPLAMHGYDPVAYFTEGKPRSGKSEHAFLHKGAIYWFASAKHQDLFKADPDKYAPQYGGYCAFGVTQQTKFDGNPHMWTIHKGKLYLNVNAQIQRAFKNDIAGNVVKANDIWPKIKGSEPVSFFQAWRERQKK